MIETISRYRNAPVLAVSLLIAGCSGASSGTGDGAGTSSGSSSGDNGSSGAGSTSSSGGGANTGSPGDDGDDGGVGASSGSPMDDGGEDDATVAADARPPRGGSMRDASTRDASVRDGSTVDAATGVPGTDGGDALAAARAQCVQIINQDRATLMPPSPPLLEDTADEACVDGQAQADFQANTAHSAFGNCKERAQDECPGWPGPPSSIMTKCLAQMWAEGPPASGDNHWLNMSNSKYKKVACGFYQTPTGKWWATQDFY